MSFAMRRIDITVNLGQGDKGDEPGPDVTLSGYRCSVGVESALMGSQSSSKLTLAVWGLSADMLNCLTTTGPYVQDLRKNRIRVFAGDERGMYGMVFDGEIDASVADYGKLPDVAWHVTATTHLTGAVKPVPPSSFKDAVDVQTFMESKAVQMGLGFEGNGVSVKLPPSYFPGTALDQVKACARAANVPYSIEHGILAIWPPDAGRQSAAVEISPETGLMGYPSFTSSGVTVNMLYNPSLSASLVDAWSVGDDLSPPKPAGSGSKPGSASGSGSGSRSGSAFGSSSGLVQTAALAASGKPAPGGKTPTADQTSATKASSPESSSWSLGMLVMVRTSLGMANGLWVVTAYKHTLSALMAASPGGGGGGGGAAGAGATGAAAATAAKAGSGTGGGGQGGGSGGGAPAGGAAAAAAASGAAASAGGWTTQLTCVRPKNGK
ncbi:hypothetical protein [Bordetella sp. LUAb4]|uniref:baseplate hub protein n=1 Tax=Bordetella sp. LUAb4 TaxID=2843195 RepID=UPI001E57E86D|nr:hypothetical protein [Bordetella sp. LUAb4]